MGVMVNDYLDDAVQFQVHCECYAAACGGLLRGAASTSTLPLLQDVSPKGFCKCVLQAVRVTSRELPRASAVRFV